MDQLDSVLPWKQLQPEEQTSVLPKRNSSATQLDVQDYQGKESQCKGLLPYVYN